METFKIEILLLDDEEASLEYSRQVIAGLVPDSMIHTARTVEQALQILQTVQIRLAFLDIELTRSDGFTFCQYIHREYPRIKVAILTGHVELGAKSYDYEPFDFLVKPVDVLRVERTLRRFQQAQPSPDPARIAIDTGSGLVLLNAKDILYISKSGNCCQVHCLGGQEHRVSCTLDKLESMLDGQGFFRTHQSFLVPVEHIQQVRSTKFGNSYEVCLDQGSVIPVSRSKYSQLKDFLLYRSLRL